MERREFLTAASGAGAATAVTAPPAAAQEGEGRPDWGGWLEGVDGGFRDARGEDEVTVAVGAEGNGGNFAFSPAGLWIDSGTHVLWEWTGQGGAHNVIAEEGPADLDSGNPVSEPGVHYEWTFEEGGITKYFCAPHRNLGMLGAVAVGDDVPTTGGGDGGGGEGIGTRLPDAAKALGVASAGGLASTLALAYLFIKYGSSSR